MLSHLLRVRRVVLRGWVVFASHALRSSPSMYPPSIQNWVSSPLVGMVSGNRPRQSPPVTLGVYKGWRARRQCEDRGMRFALHVPG
jgi:hypothetical protein